MRSFECRQLRDYSSDAEIPCRENVNDGVLTATLSLVPLRELFDDQKTPKSNSLVNEEEELGLGLLEKEFTEPPSPFGAVMHSISIC